MKNFTCFADVPDPAALVEKVLETKADPLRWKSLGQGRTLGLLFLNPSLRTRLSTQKAAQNLGMDVLPMNAAQDGWALEYRDGARMDSDKAEHVAEAAAVLGQYVDILGLRVFPSLTDRAADDAEHVFGQFARYSGKPMLSLESATRHPLQSLADAATLQEMAPKGRRPRVVLTWAPHVRALPQAVPNSFAEWMRGLGADFAIAHPEGYELDPGFVGDTPVLHDQRAALEGADFVYVKNWSAREPYGAVLRQEPSWMLTEAHLRKAPDAKVMHCLPVRRGVELADEILDGPRSLVLRQAANRVWAAQAVLRAMLEQL